MLTKKCFSVLMLVITIQFSQTYGAPSGNGSPDIETSRLEGVQNLENSDFTLSEKPNEFNELDKKEESEVLQTTEPLASGLERNEEISTFGREESPIINQDENRETAFQASTVPEPEATGSANALYGLPTQTLSREAELELLNKIPEFQTIMRSIEELPAEIYYDIKVFLENIVPRMPTNNLVTLHFRNSQTMMQLFERVIKVASAVDDEDHKLRQNLINRVHRVAPELKYEMEFTNKFIGDAKTALSNAGTNTIENKQAAQDDSSTSVVQPVEEESQPKDEVSQE